MSRKKVGKVVRQAQALLKESGLPHEFRRGGHHIKIFIQNELAMVMSASDIHTDCKLLQTIIKRRKCS